MTAPRIAIGTLQSDGTIAWRDITQSIAATCDMAVSEVESRICALRTPTWTAEQSMRALGIRPYEGPVYTAPGYVSPRRAARRAHQRRMKRRAR